MDEKLQLILNEMGITLTGDQYRAFNSIKEKRNTLIVGRPGVGKSLLIDVLNRYYGDKIVVGSTTGISNQRLFNGKGGMGSMHRIFDLPITLFNESHKKKVSSYCNELLSKNHDLEYILIDEAGFLLNSDLLQLIKHRIDRFNRKFRSRPRRDIKLILCGDFLQLPVFFNDLEKDYMTNLYGSPYFFKSNVFKEMDFNIVSINEVMRTDNPTFKAALDVLRYNQEERYERLCKWLNSTMYKNNTPDGLPMMSCWNAEAEKINQEQLARNPNELWTYPAEIEGNFNIKNCPSGEEVDVKVGALVMTLVNDNQNEDFSNGSIGEVTFCDLDGLYVKMFHSGQEVRVGLHEFEQMEMVEDGIIIEDGQSKPKISSKVAGTCKALPVRLAYGLSIHKNQGANIQSPCIVDLGKWGFKKTNNFGESIAYVGLSRFSDPNDVYLKYPITPRHLKVNKEILEWILKYSQ